MGKHPVFGKTKRTRATDGSIKDTSTGIRFDKSPYYWWWRALRLSTRYKAACTLSGKPNNKIIARLYSDFGDIFAQDFEPWWRERGALLFGEPPAPTSVKQVALDDIESYRKTVETEQTIIVAIPLFLSKKQIATSLRKVVATKHMGKPGRSSVSTRKALTQAKYKLNHYKGIASISRALEIVEKRRAGALLKTLAKSVDEDLSSVSRLMKMGETLIRHVERGEFPITRDVKSSTAFN